MERFDDGKNQHLVSGKLSQDEQDENIFGIAPCKKLI